MPKEKIYTDYLVSSSLCIKRRRILMFSLISEISEEFEKVVRVAAGQGMETQR